MRTYQRGERDAQDHVVFNPEKAADVPWTSVKVRGVELQSRYGFGAEYLTMSRVVMALPEDLTRRLSLMWCDSKACAVYSVEGELRQYDIDLIGKLFVLLSGGHNGICGPDDLYVDPDWSMDEDDPDIA